MRTTLRIPLLALAGALLPALAQAEEWGSEGPDVPEPVAAPARADPRSNWLSVALHTPLSLAILSQDEVRQAALLLGGLDLDLSLGGRIGRSTRLAYELSAGVRSTLGVVDHFRLQPFEPSPSASLDDSFSYVLPLGVCLDWLPEGPSGWFGSLHLGLGTFSPPDFMASGELDLAGRAALDLGWLLPLESTSLGLSARYSLLGLRRLRIEQTYSGELTAHELSLGVSWLL